MREFAIPTANVRTLELRSLEEDEPQLSLSRKAMT